MQRWRKELTAQKRATVRFKTAPGYQLEIDFGDTKVWIGEVEFGSPVCLHAGLFSLNAHPGIVAREAGGLV